MPLTKDVWLSWRGSSTTEKFFNDIEEMIQNNINILSHGVTLGENTGELTARVVGRIEALRAILEYRPEFDEEENNA